MLCSPTIGASLCFRIKVRSVAAASLSYGHHMLGAAALSAFLGCRIIRHTITKAGAVNNVYCFGERHIIIVAIAIVAVVGLQHIFACAPRSEVSMAGRHR